MKKKKFYTGKTPSLGETENLGFKSKMHIECKKLFIGDICYALREDKYNDTWGSMNYGDGVIMDSDAVYAIVVHTAHGDGVYYGGTGNEYNVDTGVIGVTNMDYLREDDNLRGGYVLDLPCTDVKVYVSYVYGRIDIEIYSDDSVIFEDDDSVIFDDSIYTD